MEKFTDGPLNRFFFFFWKKVLKRKRKFYASECKNKTELIGVAQAKSGWTIDQETNCEMIPTLHITSHVFVSPSHHFLFLPQQQKKERKNEADTWWTHRNSSHRNYLHSLACYRTVESMGCKRCLTYIGTVTGDHCMLQTGQSTHWITDHEVMKFFFFFKTAPTTESMGRVHIASWYPKLNGTHCGLSPSSIHKMAALSGSMVYSNRSHSLLRELTQVQTDSSLFQNSLTMCQKCGVLWHNE